MITIQEINDDNFYKVLALKVTEDQANFVAPNVQSLAECYLYRNNNDVFPYAILNDDQVIGFVLLESYEEYDAMSIWRIMIDAKHQHQGLGHQSIQAVIHFTQEHFPFAHVTAAVVKDNTKAYALFQSLGFLETGVDEHHQISLRYTHR